MLQQVEDLIEDSVPVRDAPQVRTGPRNSRCIVLSIMMRRDVRLLLWQAVRVQYTI